MSRRSAASLSVVAAIRDFAPAPVDLSEDAAKLWHDVIRTKPVEWFGCDTYPLLAAYCQGAADLSRSAAKLQAFDTKALTTDDKVLARYERLHRIVDQQRKTLAMLATKMRLAQQSRYDDQRSATAHKRGNVAQAGSRPWDTQ